MNARAFPRAERCCCNTGVKSHALCAEANAALDLKDHQRFNVPILDQPIIHPLENLQAFKNEPALIGVVPISPIHRGKFAILLEPVAANQIAHYACVGGVTVARLNVVDEAHHFADVAGGHSDYLESCPSGAATIIRKQPGTGTKWALVSIGSTGEDICRFRLTKDLTACGHASVVKIVYTPETQLCKGAEIITVIDSPKLIIRKWPLSSATFGWPSGGPRASGGNAVGRRRALRFKFHRPIQQFIFLGAGKWFIRRGWLQFA